MARILIGFILCILFLNCEKKKENKDIKSKDYIISYEDKKLQNYIDSLKKNKSDFVAFPRKGFYSEHQLIIDKKGDFYYYQKEYTGTICGTGLENDTLPHFLNLQPKDIVKIPQESINDFLSENILNKEERYRILIIASQNDTIKNTSFFNFINKNKLRAFEIRRTTQEEDTVLKYKNNRNEHIYYYPDSIKWDKTKMKLPEKFD